MKRKVYQRSRGTVPLIWILGKFRNSFMITLTALEKTAGISKLSQKQFYKKFLKS
jgi:hypothetical protein